MPPDHYLTADQIADELDVHRQTVQRWFRTGELPGRKVGKQWRTTRAALDRYVEGTDTPQQPAPLETKDDA